MVSNCSSVRPIGFIDALSCCAVTRTAPLSRRLKLREIQSLTSTSWGSFLLSGRRLRRTHSLELADDPAPAPTLRRPLLQQLTREPSPSIKRSSGGRALEPARNRV